MKSLIVSVLILVLLLDPVNLFCQTNRLDIGIEGGPSVIFINGSCDHLNPGIGFSAGPFIQYNFRKFFSIRADFSFERKGERDINSHGEISRINYNYLISQIFGRMTFGKKINFFFQTGLFSGYLLRGYTVNNAWPKELGRTYETTQFFNRFDWGLSTGIGMNIPLWQRFLVSVEVRYNLGLYQIVKDDISQESHWYEKTNSVNFLVGVAYRFSQRKNKE
ncbi:MAG: porin family protein [Bacteroidota bacterium]